jgi:hypothetical protein
MSREWGYADEEVEYDRVDNHANTGMLRELTVAANSKEICGNSDLFRLTTGLVVHEREVYGKVFGTEEIDHASMDPRDVGRRSAC